MSDPLFAEFLEAHGQEKILKVIKEENKAEESTIQEKTDEEPLNKIANTDISDFEVCNFSRKLYNKYFCIIYKLLRIFF